MEENQIAKSRTESNFFTEKKRYFRINIDVVFFIFTLMLIYIYAGI